MSKVICIIVMGVSGSGKTTIGKYLSQKLQCTFIDGDDLHPKSNIDKMSKGIALNDTDRQPWLEKIGAVAMSFISKKESIIIACSALKRQYRDLLRREISPIQFLFLSGTYEQILERLNHREGHFMPESLLKSQFEILEIPSVDEKDVTTINIGQEEKECVDAVLLSNISI